VVIGDYHTSNWNKVLRTAKMSGVNYIEVEDDNGSAIVFSMNESSSYDFNVGDMVRWSNPKNYTGLQALYGVISKDRGQKVDIQIIGTGSNDTNQPEYGPNRTPWKMYSKKEIADMLKTITAGEGYEKKYLTSWEYLMENRKLHESVLLSKLGNNVEHETVASMMAQDEYPSDEILAAMKKLGCKAEECVVIGEYSTDNWNKVLRTAKSSGIEYIEIEDENGSAIVFSNK